MTNTTPTGPRNAFAEVHLDAKVAVAVARAQAQLSADSHNLTAEDVEDIAQDAVLGLLSGGDFLRLSAAAVHIAVSRAVESEMSRRAGVHLVDSQAMAVLDDVVGLEQALLGRDLTNGERDDLANSVRRGWHDQTELPAANFARPLVLTRGNEKEGEAQHHVFSLSDPEVATAAGQVEADPPADRTTDWWEDELDAGLITVNEARIGAWNHFSREFGVPRAPQELIGKAASRAATQSIRARGGVAAVAGALLARGAEADWRGDPLFTPWPFADGFQRRRIAKLFASDRRQYAEGLWKSAADTATDTAEHGLIDRGLRPQWFVPSPASGLVGHMIWA